MIPILSVFFGALSICRPYSCYKALQECYSLTDKNAPIALEWYHLDETEFIVLHKLPLNCSTLFERVTVFVVVKAFEYETLIPPFPILNELI